MLRSDPGLLPGWESLRNGDIKAKQKMTANLLRGFYSSTHQPDPISGQPFAADAIISNPPAFAHIHIAEALGLPLLMSFSEFRPHITKDDESTATSPHAPAWERADSKRCRGRPQWFMGILSSMSD